PSSRRNARPEGDHERRRGISARKRIASPRTSGPAVVEVAVTPRVCVQLLEVAGYEVRKFVGKRSVFEPIYLDAVHDRLQVERCGASSAPAVRAGDHQEPP